MADFTKTLQPTIAPVPDGTYLRDRQPLYLHVTPSNGEEVTPLLGRWTHIDPGATFTQAHLFPADAKRQITELLASGRIRKVGIYRDRDMAAEHDLDPAFKETVEAKWNRDHSSLVTEEKRYRKPLPVEHLMPLVLGDDVYEVCLGKAVTGHQLFGVFQEYRRFTKDALAADSREAESIVKYALAEGIISMVGRIAPGNVVEEIPPEKRAATPVRADRIKLDRAQIEGTILMQWPVYRVAKAFEGFSVDALLTPAALGAASIPDAADKVRALAKAGKIQVIARWDGQEDFLVINEDDLHWAEAFQPAHNLWEPPALPLQ